MNKSIVASKVVWFNLLTFVMLAIPLFTDNEILPAKIGAVLVPLINLALRIWFTAEPLTETAARKADQAAATRPDVSTAYSPPSGPSATINAHLDPDYTDRLRAAQSAPQD